MLLKLEPVPHIKTRHQTPDATTATHRQVASVIYEMVETEVREQLRKRQLAANPRKDDR